MVGNDVMDILLQIAREFCSNGGRRHNECWVIDCLRALQRWWVVMQRMLHYRSPESSAAMVGGDTMDTVLQIAWELYNNGV
ncbi:unnamed protein product [Sphagnum balticum]